ncbi:MAG TPA: DUF2075 domain-containing protein [Candidatus Competibacteraceae bacterium]|nr:MAG: DUF2075 domain-containing protein [Candidatus Competibacteraceae bacterium]HNW78174.1 DUF2075 domain-containing protein [Candidatus Competibacteraceae bacterium]HQC72266.1 DUF2075 domain-containing protein [Candidatus Competibacteraceae bacterium]
MKRWHYGSTIGEFLLASEQEILGKLVEKHAFSLEQTQRNAWAEQISILKNTLGPYAGRIYFEYSIPRMGKRIDVVLLIESVVFVLEFKVGEKEFPVCAIDQVFDYALDLKNFHKKSHHATIVPILISTQSNVKFTTTSIESGSDGIISPILANSKILPNIIADVLRFFNGESLDPVEWEQSQYQPTPTIIEAAMALYSGHSVSEISRSDAGAINLGITSDTISDIIHESKVQCHKSICFVTGVPGSGKTLVGLNIATRHLDRDTDLYSVFLSGNGPLVAVLREALARDQVKRARESGRTSRKGHARSEVKAFIQNVHHFRDECLIDIKKPPIEHVALFDEAQRAWDLQQTVNFMSRKRDKADFNRSEPEFLISCLDRHPDWAVVVCLVGGGQEINTGEAGISEWLESLLRSFPDWHVYISPRLAGAEYRAEDMLQKIKQLSHVAFRDELHLAVSMRSFRAEHLALFVQQLLDLQAGQASEMLEKIREKYPIVMTRDLAKAKKWLRKKARGSERYGVVVSSQAQRLKPHAIDVKSPVDPIHWFLDGKDDVRSSYYMEDVATEFQVQGLELDWACVAWDADFRYSPAGWQHWSFVGDRWNRIRKEQRQIYLKNAYRVLLTRARQGMVIFVPHGDDEDPTRLHEFYDHTFDYFHRIGLEDL